MHLEQDKPWPGSMRPTLKSAQHQDPQPLRLTQYRRVFHISSMAANLPSMTIQAACRRFMSFITSSPVRLPTLRVQHVDFNLALISDAPEESCRHGNWPKQIELATQCFLIGLFTVKALLCPKLGFL